MTQLQSRDLSTGSNLLIVDDEPMMQNIYKSMFSAQSFVCDYATGGAEALDFLEGNNSYDLVLLDFMMPGVSGEDVCRQLRKYFLPVELPIIAVMASSEEEELTRELSLGVNDYLIKPFTQIDLLARINAHLNLLELNSSFQRFVPKEFLQQLGRDSIMNVDLGDQVEGEMTVLFADIRQFTKMSENLTPQQNFEFINGFLREMTPIIRSCSGFIDKFVGDAIMALFPICPDDAIKAAQLMVKAALNMKVPEAIQYLAPIKIGIGMHTGRVMLGTIGDKYRMDVTVISDAVNLASRLEAVTKDFDCLITMSAETLQKCRYPERIDSSKLGSIRVKGKEREVTVYRVDL